MKEQPTTRADSTRRSLDDWLNYQQSLHTRGIDLGLERVARVWQTLGAVRPAPIVITVGGTNGKGSTVAFLEAILRAAGYRVGCYTSPHLLRYNERVRCLGVEASDSDLIRAFERIEAARGDSTLTYFEFGTLAAFLLFAEAKLDVALLEVGLGGRLDAVNIIDADAAIVTTVDLDHQDYLGNDRESIGREKAGIFRTSRPAIIAEHDPPQSLLSAAHACAAQLIRAGQEFKVSAIADGYRWSDDLGMSINLPAPTLDAPCQIDNAGAAIAALLALRPRLAISHSAVAQGVATAHVAGRMQRFPGAVELIVDVAHNPQAARVLADWLARHPVAGNTLAVFSALADKDLAGIMAPLTPFIGSWFVGGLSADSPRGQDGATLAGRMKALAPAATVNAFDRLNQALSAAEAEARPGDRILAFGSFFTAAAALRYAEGKVWEGPRLSPG